MSRVPVYFSHSYRREDRDVNSFFWRAFYDAGFSFTVDPGATSFYTTALELMMARSPGFAAVVTFRQEEDRYQCSPFILYEYGIAEQMHQPRLVLRDKRVPPRYFRGEGTRQLAFDVAALDRCEDELASELRQFYALTSVRCNGNSYRRSRVGVALAGGTGREVEARYTIVETCLDSNGDEAVNLTAHADDPFDLTQQAGNCDFAIVDIDDPITAGIADYLSARGTPLLKVARRGGGPIAPARLLGSAPLQRAAAPDELVTYWGDVEEFKSRVRHQITRALTDRTELTGIHAGHRYFRSLGREAGQVFVSNARTANGVAKEVSQALNLENIPFFHYRFHNPIGRGQRWTDQLDRMVTASKIFVPIIDESYWSSDFCMQEYTAALRLEDAGRITIVPVLLDGHEAGPEVPYQGIDLNDRSHQEGVTQLVRNLDDLLAASTDRSSYAVSEGPIEAGRFSVDIAIITILEEEYEAVLRLLRKVRQVTGSATLSNPHAWVVGEVDSPNAPVPYTVALAMSPHTGTNAAVIVTKNTVEAFDPRCVLVVGVAGGFGGLRYGDVVVADRICAYEYGRVDNGLFLPRHDLDSPADAAITSAARTLTARYPDWHAKLSQVEGSPPLTPKIVVGQVASGDKVIDDPTADFFASVIASRPMLQAVEMEGAGVAAAIQDIRETQRSVSFGMIRGISDLPPEGGSRSSRSPGQPGQAEIRAAWKARASATAALAAIQLIRLSWARPPRAGYRR